MTTAGRRPVPMFPLGTVLFPLAVIPLHVFEPRYRTMVRTALDGDRRFGVVLIERGSEVGGGDQRSDVGTLAEVVQAAELPDGRWALLAVGRQRIRVTEWLPDDPHPWAVVDPHPDRSGPTAEAVEPVAALVRRSLALRRELGEWDGPLEPDVPDDPSAASWVLAAMAGLRPQDAQRLLADDDGPHRLAALHSLVADAVEVLELRLDGGR